MISPFLYYSPANQNEKAQARSSHQFSTQERRAQDRAATSVSEQSCLSEISCCFCPIPRLKPQNAVITPRAPSNTRSLADCCGLFGSKASPDKTHPQLSTILEEDSAVDLWTSDSETGDEDSTKRRTTPDVSQKNTLPGERSYSLFLHPLASFSSETSLESNPDTHTTVKPT